MNCLEIMIKGVTKIKNLAGKQLFISFLAQWLAVEGISKTSSLSQGI